MNKMRLSFISTVLVILCVLGMSVSLAAAEEPTSQSTVRVELTDLQKSEIANLHKDIMAKKEQLITKYVEYGVITEEKGKKIISHMEERYKMLEQNGFNPKNKHKHKDKYYEHKNHE